MIDRQSGQIIFVCDSCDETFKGAKGDNFDAVWGKAKGEGWLARKVANEWLHGCPQCGVPT